MIISRLIGLFAVSISLWLSACASVPVEDDSVFDFYNTLSAAFGERDSREIFPLLSHSSVAYYDDVHSLAISGKDIDSIEKHFVQKMHIAKYRAFLLRCLPLPSSADEALALYVASGALDANNFSQSVYSSHEITGNRAYVSAVADNNQEMRSYTLIWEGGGWKLDLEAVYAQLNLALAEKRKDWDLSYEEMMSAYKKSVGLPEDQIHQE